MFVIDHTKIDKKVKVMRSVAKYFSEDRNIPVLAIDGNVYYFADTELFREVLESAPTWVKVLTKFTQ